MSAALPFARGGRRRFSLGGRSLSHESFSARVNEKDHGYCFVKKQNGPSGSVERLLVYAPDELVLKLSSELSSHHGTSSLKNLDKVVFDEHPDVPVDYFGPRQPGHDPAVDLAWFGREELSLLDTTLDGINLLDPEFLCSVVEMVEQFGNYDASRNNHGLGHGFASHMSCSRGHCVYGLAKPNALKVPPGCPEEKLVLLMRFMSSLLQQIAPASVKAEWETEYGVTRLDSFARTIHTKNLIEMLALRTTPLDAEVTFHPDKFDCKKKGFRQVIHLTAIVKRDGKPDVRITMGGNSRSSCDSHLGNVAAVGPAIRRCMTYFNALPENRRLVSRNLLHTSDDPLSDDPPRLLPAHSSKLIHQMATAYFSQLLLEHWGLNEQLSQRYQPPTAGLGGSISSALALGGGYFENVRVFIIWVQEQLRQPCPETIPPGYRLLLIIHGFLVEYRRRQRAGELPPLAGARNQPFMTQPLSEEDARSNVESFDRIRVSAFDAVRDAIVSLKTETKQWSAYKVCHRDVTGLRFYGDQQGTNLIHTSCIIGFLPLEFLRFAVLSTNGSVVRRLVEVSPGMGRGDVANNVSRFFYALRHLLPGEKDGNMCENVSCETNRRLDVYDVMAPGQPAAFMDHINGVLMAFRHRSDQPVVWNVATRADRPAHPSKRQKVAITQQRLALTTRCRATLPSPVQVRIVNDAPLPLPAPAVVPVNNNQPVLPLAENNLQVAIVPRALRINQVGAPVPIENNMQVVRCVRPPMEAKFIPLDTKIHTLPPINAQLHHYSAMCLSNGGPATQSHVTKAIRIDTAYTRDLRMIGGGRMTAKAFRAYIPFTPGSVVLPFVPDDVSLVGQIFGRELRFEDRRHCWFSNPSDARTYLYLSIILFPRNRWILFDCIIPHLFRQPLRDGDGRENAPGRLLVIPRRKGEDILYAVVERFDSESYGFALLNKSGHKRGKTIVINS